MIQEIRFLCSRAHFGFYLATLVRDDGEQSLTRKARALLSTRLSPEASTQTRRCTEEDSAILELRADDEIVALREANDDIREVEKLLRQAGYAKLGLVEGVTSILESGRKRAEGIIDLTAERDALLERIAEQGDL